MDPFSSVSVQAAPDYPELSPPPPPPPSGGFFCGLLADALHVARLADEARHARNAAAFDADLGENLIDHRRLHAIAKRRIDHFVGRAAAAIAATAAVEAVDLKDADAFDLLHRLDAFAHDALDALQQPAAEDRRARRIGQHVLRLVEQPLRFGFDGGAHLLGGRGDANFLGLLLGDQHFDLTPAPRHFAFAHCLDPLLGLDRLRARSLGIGLRRRLLARLAGISMALSMRAFSTAVSRAISSCRNSRSRRMRASSMPRSEAMPRALDFLARGDLGLLQRLAAGDLELLDRSAALQPGKLDRLFAHHIGTADLLRGDDVGFLDLAIGISALDELGCNLDRTFLLGDLDDLAAFDVENVAGLRRFDPFALERKLGGDPRRLDCLAPPDFGVLDRLFAGDVARSGCLLGRDALGSDRFSCAMRLPSTVSRAAISAVSTARLRAISSVRTSSSRAIRSPAILRSSAMRTVSTT